MPGPSLRDGSSYISCMSAVCRVHACSRSLDPDNDLVSQAGILSLSIRTVSPKELSNLEEVEQRASILFHLNAEKYLTGEMCSRKQDPCERRDAINMQV